MEHRCVALACAFLGAAVGLGPAVQAKPKPKPGDDAVVIRYFLPRTVLSLGGTMTLKDCTEDRIAIELAPQLLVKSEPGQEVTLTMGALRSARFKRNLKVSTREDGTISGLNSDVTDELPATIGSVLKTVATVVGVVAPLTKGPSLCNTSTEGALEKIKELNGKIKKEYDSIDRETVGKSLKLIELYSRQITSNKNFLTKKIEDNIVYDNSDNKDTVYIKLDQFLKNPKNMMINIDGYKLKNYKNTEIKKINIDQKSPEIYLPNTEYTAIKIVFSSSDAKKLSLIGGLEIGQSVFVQQEGKEQRLPLKTGFGGAFTYSAKYDQFGHATEQEWTSEASAKTVASAMEGYASTAAGMVPKPKPAADPLAEDKAAVEALKVKQERKRLEMCQAILDAGGSSCPTGTGIGQ